MKHIVRNKIHEHRSLYSTLSHLRYLFHNVKHPIKDIVVCGVPRSGSTLLFNLIRELVKIELDRLDGFFTTEIEYQNLLSKERSFFVKKNHEVSWLLIKRIKSNLSLGFFTHRDIRDVVVSLMQKGWMQDFNTWIERKGLHTMVNNSLIYASVKNMNTISYEELTNDRLTVVNNIKKILNLDHVDESSMKMIVRNSSIEEIRKKIENISVDDEYDRATHLHKDHIADAEMGKWRRHLSDDQVEVINAISREYLIRFNYLT
jgi:hypothetical protein